MSSGRRALAEGSLWIARNADTLAEILAPVEITRWQDWSIRDEFSAAHRAILDYRKTDRGFAEAVEADAGALAARQARRGEAVPASWWATAATMCWKTWRCSPSNAPRGRQRKSIRAAIW